MYFECLVVWLFEDLITTVRIVIDYYYLSKLWQKNMSQTTYIMQKEIPVTK